MILVEVFKNISYIVAFVGILSSLYKFARNIEKRFDRLTINFVGLIFLNKLCTNGKLYLQILI